MKEKKKAVSTTANLLNNRSKDSKSSRIIQQVRSIFLSGRKVRQKKSMLRHIRMMPGVSSPPFAMMKGGR